MFKPLSDVKVVDLGQVLAGPYATYQLAMMGAEVIKVEMPGIGDWSRAGEGLPDMDPDGDGAGMGIAYLTQNAGKKSIALDLKTAAGMAVLRKLIAQADVFVENFKPGTAARLGLSFAEVRALKADIVYCSISAYGQDGPISHRPAYDHVVQGMCGIMRTTGTAESEPNKVGAPYVDFATGLNAAFAITSALHETRRSGQAQHVDVAMLDTSMLLMASLVTKHLNTGWQPKANGNEAWSQSPASGAFDTADGKIMIAANNPAQFPALCQAIGRTDLLGDAASDGPYDWQQRSGELREELIEIFAGKSAEAWEELLDGAQVPAAKIRTLAEVLAEDQLQARGLTKGLELPGSDKPLQVPTLGFKVNGQTVAPTTAPPRLGADSDEILRGLNYSPAEIASLHADGVV